MPALKEFKTISALFEFVTTDFGSKQTKPVLKHKYENEFVDISYTEFREATENLALGLAAMGIKRNDKVAIIGENRPEWVYSDFAILGLGAIDVPLYPILTSETIEFILNDSGSKGIIVSNKFQLNKVLKVRDNCKTLQFIVVMNDLDEADRLGPEVYSLKEIQGKGKEFQKENPDHFVDSLKIAQPDDVCTIIYTSGTTGEPKGVILTHWNIMSNVKAAHEIFNIGDKDIFLSFLPLCHIFERMAGYYTALAAGSTIAYAESIEKIAQNMGEIKPTLMTAVPRLFERMYSRIRRNVESQPEKKQKIFNWGVETGKEYMEYVRNGENPPIGLNLKRKLADKLVYSKLRERTGGKLRFFISGGAALARELGQFFEAVGILIVEGYGLTESSPVIAANREHDYKFGTVGKVMPGVEVKIASDGEILASGPNIMKGYYNNKKETEAVLKDGWLHTGDIGVFDAEGFLIITDRKKHLFKTSGGKYVAPTPIENMFLASKYIEQFVLIGDRRMFLTALIVPDYEALREYADAHRISYSTNEDIVKMKQIYELLEKELGEFQKKLAAFEKVRRFTLLDKPFTIEDGELTPKLSVKRKVIEERYKDLIDDMYKGLES
ncbi:MAG: long-chain fatty acid--CoA ligase [Melioribacteraceae bacterium]|nr:long-chain fatty acid--CoA ligase [Melioribacteraceae bacterium]MCF8355312.1 long-chain fatty acid--CoA ligase [Melioribacteraceae bacterium]MCF8395697.1 long-chain fatty acid--CoA ligase [Melioribacteraceae bacterium]MCF8420390.1 long-chain fatty acid--CoA ligase [Melioribacteraceae bacterium]